VERHPNPDHTPSFPLPGVKRALGDEGGPEGFRGGGEGGAEGVPHRLEDEAPVGFDGFLQNLVVAGEGKRMADGSRSQRRVEPSMSVNRKVTVPVGKTAIR
jgi:hypothetical protein